MRGTGDLLQKYYPGLMLLQALLYCSSTSLMYLWASGLFLQSTPNINSSIDLSIWRIFSHLLSKHSHGHPASQPARQGGGRCGSKCLVWMDRTANQPGTLCCLCYITAYCCCLETQTGFFNDDTDIMNNYTSHKQPAIYRDLLNILACE